MQSLIYNRMSPRQPHNCLSLVIGDSPTRLSQAIDAQCQRNRLVSV